MKTLLAVCMAAEILGACSQAPPPADWEARIRAANDALLNEGDVDRVADFFLPTYVSHATEGDVRGPEGITAFVTSLRHAFPDLRVEIQVLATEGDRVAWVRTHHGTQHGRPDPRRSDAV